MVPSRYVPHMGSSGIKGLNRMLQLNVMPQVQAFCMDFEIAAHNAALTVFHNRSIDGCFSHLTQSTWRKIQELSLAGRYNMDPPFQLGMNTIRNNALINNELIDVLRLLDYTWVKLTMLFIYIYIYITSVTCLVNFPYRYLYLKKRKVKIASF